MKTASSPLTPFIPSDCTAALSVLYASTVAMLVVWADGYWAAIATLLVVPIIVLTLWKPWLGWLTIFPLLFMLHPAPPSIGIREGMFAVLIITLVCRSAWDQYQQGGWGSLGRSYRWIAFLGIGVIFINFLTALYNHVPLSDWVRGVAPFLFLFLMAPLRYEISKHEDRAKDIVLSLMALFLLYGGQVILVFLVERVYDPYWLINNGGAWVRIGAGQLSGHNDAIGPLIDRVTLLLPRSTDAIIPVGAATAMIAAICAPTWRITVTALGLAMFGLSAVLFTYTRSMLLSVAAAVFIYMVFLWGTKRLRAMRAIAVVFTLAVWSLLVVYMFGIDGMWLKRMGSLAHSTTSIAENPRFSANAANPRLSADDHLDINITTRLDEISIATDKFVQHPLVGVGLGSRHPMDFYGENGVIHLEVGYIHNWLFYFLMTSGLVGTLLYSSVLGIPILRRAKYASDSWLINDLIKTAALTFAIYAMTFAVFRLISFNLVIAAIWAILLAQTVPKRMPSNSIQSTQK